MARRPAGGVEILTRTDSEKEKIFPLACFHARPRRLFGISICWPEVGAQNIGLVTVTRVNKSPRAERLL